MVEGGSSRDFAKTRSWAYQNPDSFQKLIDILVKATGAYLSRQIASGVETVQLFDSWAGALSTSAYERFVLPYTKEIFSAIQNEEVPTIHFGVGTGEILHLMASAGSSVMGVDWRTPLDVARDRLGLKVALQGMKLIIPENQRGFSWDTRNIQELMSDVELATRRNNMHYPIYILTRYS